MNQAAERREFLRANLNVFIHEEAERQSLLARALDVSERGIRYLMPGSGREEDEPASIPVTLEFCLPGDDRPIRALGRVVYGAGDGILQQTAVEFTRLEGADAGRIRRYVLQRRRAEMLESLRQEHLLH
ncbi:MAG TPA: PilZ domain-containing protein [Myxococcota bacterium]|nr:PilZ domain-containing protein [Myxococcota bacterium]HRY92921.1 PilZ domain-containing protein [Myxococcota bacterium]HSA19860.1 PilZ domain-containing protein [Myxococcota bacterium]